MLLAKNKNKKKKGCFVKSEKKRINEKNEDFD
jgi:hypothetical protein